ncbi:MAG: magnesium transporter, partial [Acidimicrobiales bacterium]|nr:magnesium transporter [Acidimicrobiales bacterium]
VRLTKDVLDHQLVDVDGVQVVRASDLYVAPILGNLRLVGVDVGMSSLLRRLGPKSLRKRPTPDQVIDWAAIQPFEDIDHEEGDAVSSVRLKASNEGLHRLRPGELADLLEDLGRGQRQELLRVLETGNAADALEEMDPEELENLLRESDPKKAAQLLSSMEPDEAVDALRDLSKDESGEILSHMNEEKAHELEELLSYPEDQAGGFMTSHVVVVTSSHTVADAIEMIRASVEHGSEIDAVAVVDENGILEWDCPLVDLLMAEPASALSAIEERERPVTVRVDATVDEVARQLVESRRSSILVIDDGNTPIGRILADDVIDALMPGKAKLHFPRLLQ